jgi:hypothetical protein
MKLGRAPTTKQTRLEALMPIGYAESSEDRESECGCIGALIGLGLAVSEREEIFAAPITKESDRPGNRASS